MVPLPVELGAIVTTLTQQTRYDTADLLMAGDDKVFSRFMLTPTRRGLNGAELTGEEAIASGGLGAFIGFASAEFMRFDYLLGRQNCQEFLRSTFSLAANNPVFAGWTAEEKTKWQIHTPAGGDVPMLPIVPLLDEAAVDEVLDPWPKGKLDPRAISRRDREAISRDLRARAVRLSGPIGAELGGGPCNPSSGGRLRYRRDARLSQEGGSLDSDESSVYGAITG